MAGNICACVSCTKVFTKGKGLVGRIQGAANSTLNRVIDALPIELHLPGSYQYCRAGTKLEQRLARGDVGINGLDRASKVHDIAYSHYKDNTWRSEADRVLADSAWERFKAEDASYGEKAAAWALTTAMYVKARLGGGMKNKKKKKENESEEISFKGKGIAESKIKKKNKNTMKKKTTKKGGF